MADTSSSVERHQEKHKGFIRGIDLKKGARRQIWSYNSTNGGHYVSIPRDGDSTHFVKANGDADEDTPPLTVITFEWVTPKDPDAIPDDREYVLKFLSGKIWYTILASTTGVTASKDKDGTSFVPRKLESPNAAYVVFQAGSSDLYLSSDAAGKMKLKNWNTPVPYPVETSYEVDPALLFRLVRPRGEKD